MKRKNNILIYLFLAQYFSLFSHEFSFTNLNDASHVKMQLEKDNEKALHDWHFLVKSRIVSNYFGAKSVHHSVLAQASPQLQHYFATFVAPLMYNAMINNHCVAIPGYVFPDGIRHCVNQLSQFSSSDAALIKSLSKRLETYCSRIENILFKGKNHSFNDALSYKNQIKLIKGYANFLKEFYAQTAPHTFYYASQNHSLMQHVMRSIKWDQYDAGNSKNSLKKIERNNAASINGNLGKVYKALHQGDSQQAYTIGQERIKAVVQGKEVVTSVFERYPALRQKVELQYHADKAKAEQIRIAKEAALKQEAAQAQAQYQKQSNELFLQKRSDILQDRCTAAVAQYYDPKIFPQLHSLLTEQAKCINAQHLTADKKGILFEGGHLQHYLIDEAISVTDAVISGDLIESIHDAVLDLANTSISLNKEGNVLTASRALEACWALVDHAQAAAHYAYTIARTHAPLVAKGVAYGVCESLHGAVHVVCHPVEAAQDVAQSLAVAGYYLGKVAYSVSAFDAACELWEADPEHFEQKIREHLIDPEVFVAVYEHAKNNISTEDVARVGTKTAVDMMLLHGAIKAVSAVAKECWPALIRCMRKGEQSAEIALTAENIPMQCGEEIASLMENMHNVGGSSKVAAVVKEVAKEAPELLRTFNIAKYDASIGNLEKLEQAIEKLKNVEGALTKDGPLFKALEFGQKAEVLTDAKKIAEMEGRLQTARGAMYEVEKAVDLIRSGEEISHLGLKVEGITATREFDIATSTKLIECKNIDWYKQSSDKINHMRSQFGGQLKVARDKGLIFEVHSKNPISSEMKTWFIDRGIQFFEG